MPNLIEDIFENAGVKTDKYFKYDKLDIACKYFWDDGKYLMHIQIVKSLS